MTDSLPIRALRRLAHYMIALYRLTFSSLAGRQCRHFPTCSEYMDEAIQHHGLWAGLWMGIARIVRCGPFGTSGIDVIPQSLPDSAAWFKPWTYGLWRGVHPPPSPSQTDSDRSDL
jgi:uncharacterized protein